MLKPTQEQTDIVNEAALGKNLIVKAFAGAAKTTTCVMIAEKLKKKGLYVAFNKSIATEAKSKFPSGITCRTMHSLAYGYIMTPELREKLQGFFSMSDVMRLPDMEQVPIKLREEVAMTTIDVVKLFCQSSSKNIYSFVDSLDLEHLNKDLVIVYWFSIINKNNPTKITHDVYLKLFHLSMPVLGFEVIYLDEAQDSNEVILDIVISQVMFDCQIIVVGDSYQAIYEWRGAVDALEKLPDSFKTMRLTESFRFTQEIADKAFAITKHLGNSIPIIGKGKISEKVHYDKAVIVRNNATLLEVLYTAYLNDKRVHVIGSLEALWSKMYHIQDLYFATKNNPKPVKFPDKELSQYKTYKDLQIASNHIPELGTLLRLQKKLALEGNGLYSNIKAIKSILVKKPEQADFTATTAHKSKGLEFYEVTLNADLFTLPQDFVGTNIEYLQQDQVGELLYVAMTRAKFKLNLPRCVEEIL